MFSLRSSHNMYPQSVGGSSLIFISLLCVTLGGCGSGGSSAPPSVTATGTPGAEVSIGERLFVETRFAQAFKAFLDSGGNVNDHNAGDAVMNTVETTPLANRLIQAHSKACP